jgi:hypothetical protein
MPTGTRSGPDIRAIHGCCHAAVDVLRGGSRDAGSGTELAALGQRELNDMRISPHDAWLDAPKPHWRGNK